MIGLARTILAALLLALALPAESHAREPFTLESVQTKVRRDFRDVGHLSTSSLIDMIRGEENVLLFDVRERNEYAVSRIPGAIRVEPGTRQSAFMQQFGAKTRDRVVVFYCSVGVRSSKLARSVQEELKSQGAKFVFNLDGGVFAWHNEKRPLENASGETDFVHPFDSHWGKLVTRREQVRTQP